MWTPETVRWMRDAAEQGTFYERLAEAIAAMLPKRARVLDAGCGTGALALALAPYGHELTAIDVSPLALPGPEDCPVNVRPLLQDAFSFEPAEAFDALLLCYFARPEEFLRLRRLSRGQVFLTTDTLRSGAYQAALLNANLPYDERSLSLRFDQPLRSLEDAAAYAAHYGLDESGIQGSGDAAFPYRYEKTRSLTILRFAGGDCQ